MSDTDTRPEPTATARLRKADFWTGIVLALVSASMVAEALTFPLEGTYAGVRNAWYVSPALLPLIVGGVLFLLSLGLVATAVRDYRRLAPAGRLLGVDLWAGVRSSREAWLIATLLAAYFVGLIPRVDFAIATVQFLFVFIALYTVAGAGARLALAALFVVPSAAALAIGLAGAWPPPRSDVQFLLDAVALAIVLLTLAVAFVLARGPERRKLRTAAVTAILTSVVLAGLFKYGLLVPLPREGLGVAVMDAVSRALSGLFG